MKKNWFQHAELTQQQADELMARYAMNCVKTRKCLSADYKTWTVYALLPVTRNKPRVDRTYQWRFWH